MGKAAAQPKPHEPVIALMRSADAVRRELVRTLQPFDLTLQQFNVLIILRRAEGEELPTLEVAARMVEQTPGITRLMNTLSAKKYIRRQRHRDDRRQQLCLLTDAGKRVIDTVIPHILATHQRITSDLDRDEISLLMGLLDRVPRRTSDRNRAQPAQTGPPPGTRRSLAR